MINRKSGSTASVIAVSGMVFLLFKFGRFFQDKSPDLVQHYLLVSEIMKNGGVRADAMERIGAMAVYPPVAHWLAAIAGWIGGSGFVAITLVTIASLYLCYVLLMRLLGRDAAIIAFVAIFFVLKFTRSMLGWEVHINFFYPQLVADMLYLAVLLLCSRGGPVWAKAIAFTVAGCIAMWIQPLVAVHILGAGCVLVAFKAIDNWRRGIPVLIATGVAAGAIVALHPAFRVMRSIASNDGLLEFGYPHIMTVAVLCGLAGLANMWRARSRGAEFVDVVLGSAAVAGMLLTLMQFVVFKLHEGGSEYAIKKHMFLLLTFGVVNIVRVVTAHMRSAKYADLLTPIASLICCLPVLSTYDFPVSPVNFAMDRAEHMADDELPDFKPASTVFYDVSLPRMSSVMISVTAFRHPFDAHAISWLQGADMLKGSSLAMVPRTSPAAKNCSAYVAETSQYVVMNVPCQKDAKR